MAPSGLTSPMGAILLIMLSSIMLRPDTLDGSIDGNGQAAAIVRLAVEPPRYRSSFERSSKGTLERFEIRIILHRVINDQEAADRMMGKRTSGLMAEPLYRPNRPARADKMGVLQDAGALVVDQVGSSDRRSE